MSLSHFCRFRRCPELLLGLDSLRGCNAHPLATFAARKLLALLVGEPDRYAAGAFSRFDNKPFSAYHASLRRRGHVIRSMRTLLKYTAQAARRREPTVGQEAVSTRSRKRHPVRNQWFTPRQGRLKTACCLSEKGVATAKQRFDRAVGTAGAPLSKYVKFILFSTK